MTEDLIEALAFLNSLELDWPVFSGAFLGVAGSLVVGHYFDWWTSRARRRAAFEGLRLAVEMDMIVLERIVEHCKKHETPIQRLSTAPYRGLVANHLVEMQRDGLAKNVMPLVEMLAMINRGLDELQYAARELRFGLHDGHARKVALDATIRTRSDEACKQCAVTEKMLKRILGDLDALGVDSPPTGPARD